MNIRIVPKSKPNARIQHVQVYPKESPFSLRHSLRSIVSYKRSKTSELLISTLSAWQRIRHC